MGVRFFCPNCRCVLLIARRKAGTEIRCPRCDQAQTVPAETDPLAVIARRHAASPPGPDGAGQPPVDAEGMILHWIEGDEPSTEHAQAFDATVRDVRSVGPSPPSASPVPTPFIGPPVGMSPARDSSASGEVAFEELPAAAPPLVHPADRAPPAAPMAAPPIAHAPPAYEQPASRLWLALLALSLFTAAVAGAFIVGYIMGRQSNATPSQQGNGPHFSQPIGSLD